MSLNRNNTSRLTLWAALFLVGFAALVFALASPGPKPGIVRIASFSDAVDYAPYYVAREQGFIDQELRKVGATPEYNSFDALAPINDALASGRLDFVFEAEPPALIAEASGIDVDVPFLSVTLEQNIIARKALPIATVNDLAGRNIGVLTGTSSHYGIIQALQKAGIDQKAVTLTNVPPPEGRAAFRSGAIDAWAVWPPFPEVEESEGRAVEISGTAATIHSLLVARSAYARERPEVVEALITALRRAQDFIAAKPKEAQAIVARSVKQPTAVVVRAWPKHDFRPSGVRSIEQDLQSKADFLFGSGFIRSRVLVGKDLFASVPR